MITVFLPHYNRPYFLDISVKLLRHFLGDTIKIVVADDGSMPAVVKSIRKLPVDSVHVGKHSNNSFAETMRKVSLRCDTELYMFCEDDFIFTNSPVPPAVNVFTPTASDLISDVDVDTDQLNAVTVANKILSEDPSIGLIKLQVHERIANRIVGGEGTLINREGLDFYLADPSLSLSNSWPYVIRTELAKKLQPKKMKSMSVFNRQNHIKKHLYKELNAAKLKCLCLIPGRFLHIGNGISVNVTKANTDSTRRHYNNIILDIYRPIIGDISRNKYTDFPEYLAKLYTKKKFYLDLDQVLEKGANFALKSALMRLRV